MKKIYKKTVGIDDSSHTCYNVCFCSVQARTITANRIICTLYSGNAQTYTSPLEAVYLANINIIGSTVIFENNQYHNQQQIRSYCFL